MSELEEALAWQMRVAGVPTPEREYHFKIPGRRNPCRFDFAFVDRMIAVEVEGGTHQGGRHNRHAGFEHDCEKYNHAVLAGWRIIRVTSDMVQDGRALAFVEKALKATEEVV